MMIRLAVPVVSEHSSLHTGRAECCGRVAEKNVHNTTWAVPFKSCSKTRTCCTYAYSMDG